MRIKSIHIDGFGVFHNFKLDGFKKGINLVVGANEAGKSTLLQFFRYTLFGYPRSVDERMAPLKGGNHGGRIISQMKNSDRITFERMSGANGGPTKLIYPNRESNSADEWKQLLGPASPQMYENIYAFTLDELVGFDKLRESGIRDRLFSVQLGLGDVSLGEVTSNLVKPSEEIYKTRGSVQLIPKLKNELDEKLAQLRELQGKKEAYETLKTKLAALNEQITVWDAEVRDHREKLDKQERILQCYDNYYELMEVREHLKDAPEPIGYPQGLEDEMKENSRQLKQAESALEKIKDKKQRLLQQLSEITVDEDILKNESAIKWLENNLEKYKSDKKAVAKIDGEIEQEKNEIRQKLKEIGSAWKEENVRKFEGYDQKIDRIVRFQEAFEVLKEKQLRQEAAMNSAPAAASIDTKKVLVALGMLATVVGVGLLLSSLLVFGILLMVAGVGLLGYAFLGIKEESGKPAGKDASPGLNQEKEKLSNQYQEWMRSLHFDPQLQPATAKELLRKIKDLQSSLFSLDKRTRDQQELNSWIAEFESKVKNLSDSNEGIELLVARLVKSLTSEEKKDRTKTEGQQREAELKEEQADLEIEKKQVSAAVQEMLEKVKVDSEEAFYEKIQRDRQVQDWQKVEANHIKQLERIAGRGKADEVVAYLNKYGKVELETRLTQMREKVSELEQNLRNEVDERGRVKTSISNLEEVASLSELLTEISSLRNQLRDAYKEWLANQLALEVLNSEKKRFEQEKQPEVIRLSEQHFSNITQGRYPKIRMPLTGEEVKIVDAHERIKQISALSRGTREQLLISLRLGFIEEYEKRSEPLPIIMDEILVNFDPKRTRQTAEILADFAKDRQLLFFTCHPNTEQFFEGLDYHLIDLERGVEEGNTLFG